MIKINVFLDNKTWAVELMPGYVVSGFETRADAQVWIMEYIFRTMNSARDSDLIKHREETRRQMLGAAILAQSPEVKNKKQ